MGGRGQWEGASNERARAMGGSEQWEGASDGCVLGLEHGGWVQERGWAGDGRSGFARARARTRFVWTAPPARLDGCGHLFIVSAAIRRAPLPPARAGGGGGGLRLCIAKPSAKAIGRSRASRTDKPRFVGSAIARSSQAHPSLPRPSGSAVRSRADSPSLPRGPGCRAGRGPDPPRASRARSGGGVGGRGGDSGDHLRARARGRAPARLAFAACLDSPPKSRNPRALERASKGRNSDRVRARARGRALARLRLRGLLDAGGGGEGRQGGRPGARFRAPKRGFRARTRKRGFCARKRAFARENRPCARAETGFRAPFLHPVRVFARGLWGGCAKTASWPALSRPQRAAPLGVAAEKSEEKRVPAWARIEGIAKAGWPRRGREAKTRPGKTETGKDEDSEDEVSEDEVREDEVSEDEVSEDEKSKDEESEDEVSEDEVSEDEDSEDEDGRIGCLAGWPRRRSQRRRRGTQTRSPRRRRGANWAN